MLHFGEKICPRDLRGLFAVFCLFGSIRVKKIETIKYISKEREFTKFIHICCLIFDTLLGQKNILHHLR